MIAYKRGFWGIVAGGLRRIKEEIKGAGEYMIAPKGRASSFDGRCSLGVEVFDEVTQPRGSNSGSGLVRSPKYGCSRYPHNEAPGDRSSVSGSHVSSQKNIS